MQLSQQYDIWKTLKLQRFADQDKRANGVMMIK